MQDQKKTQDQLIDELNEMRRRIAEFKTVRATALDWGNTIISADQ
jgi:hypothetical protein